MLDGFGPVFKAEMLVTLRGDIELSHFDAGAALVDVLMEFSEGRKAAGLPYLTWVGTPVLFGLLRDDERDVVAGVNLATQTHPTFHSGMAHDQFTHLVQLYAEHLAKTIRVEHIYVNYLGLHHMAIYKVQLAAVGRTSA